MKPTEWEVSRCLMLERYRRNFVIPRYSPRNWWECDVFELTAAGYFREYEIKLTRGDFLADAKKDARDWNRNITRVKYHQLQAGDPAGPVQFWYVTPQGMLRPGDLPPWAGHIEFEWRPGMTWAIKEHEVVKARRLHNHTVDPKVVGDVNRTCYWRMHDLFQKRSFDPLEIIEP
jgi:hypothetical protein